MIKRLKEKLESLLETIGIQQQLADVLQVQKQVNTKLKQNIDTKDTLITSFKHKLDTQLQLLHQAQEVQQDTLKMYQQEKTTLKKTLEKNITV